MLRARMAQKDLTGLGEISALLGRGTEFEGTLVFSGRVRIDGALKGAIRGEDMLILGDGASVDADVEVGTLIVRGGELRGSVKARELVELHAGGRVRGDIESPQLFIDKGAVFEGRCTMDGAEVHPLDDLVVPASESASRPRPLGQSRRRSRPSRCPREGS